jgi:hypothetical protein
MQGSYLELPIREIQLSRREGCFVFGDSVIKRGGLFCLWRFSYQEGRVVLSLEIQLSRREGCFVFGDSVINRGGCFVFGDSVIKKGGLFCLWRFSYQEGRVAVSFPKTKQPSLLDN